MSLLFNLKKFINMFFIVILFISYFVITQLQGSESSGNKIPNHEWSFEGFTGTFDRASLQRGYKVYREVCSGMTGHNETVLVLFDSQKTSYDNLLRVFWEEHDPTQGMRQGNDVGTQYRSGIYYFNDAQKYEAIKTKEQYQKNLQIENLGTITTEITKAKEFYYAEHYHQQYLAKNPNGYCGVGGTGVLLK